MTKSRRFRITLGLITVAIVGVLACPYESSGIPEWKLRVIDDKGKPVAGVVVHEEWTYTLIEGQTSMDAQRTNAEGWITFPRRTIRGPLGLRMLTFSSSQAGEGWSTDAYVCLMKEDGDVFWNNPDPTPPRQLVAHSRECVWTNPE